MKVLIVEDDTLATEFVEKLLQVNFSDFEIVGKAKTVEEAIAIYNAELPDLLILDINLGNHTSFDLFEVINPLNLYIIFTSSYDEFAIKAIKVDAVDYLIKPINIDDFRTAIEKVEQRMKIKTLAKTGLQSLESQKRDFKDRILIFEDNRMTPIELFRIIKLKSKGAYTEFYLDDGKVLFSSRNLGTYEKFLEERNFHRIHDSCIVNMAHISRYKQGSKAEVLLSDSSTELLSRRKKKDFLKHFGI